MPGKRKRKQKSVSLHVSKRVKVGISSAALDSTVAKHLLPFYYPYVVTLRAFILHRFPQKSAELQRRFARHGQMSQVVSLLDTALIGTSIDARVCGLAQPSLERERTQRAKDFYEFTQCSPVSASSNRRISDGTNVASTLGEGSVSMGDLVDFVTWRLFNRTYRIKPRPPHVLCHGYQRSDMPKSTAEDRAGQGGIDGLTRLFVNAQAERLKDNDWVAVLRDLGIDGDHVILELLLDCGVYLPLETSGSSNESSVQSGNYWQVAGTSLSDLPVLDDKSRTDAVTTNTEAIFKLPPRPVRILRQPPSISFVRSRMFYARATLNGKGKVNFGLRHIHVLNRFADPKNDSHARHILKYIFPRQFGLHNVFTSVVDRMETAHVFKDYTLREQEIAAWARKKGPAAAVKLPRRLRGKCSALVQKMQRFHAACAYKELLLHYCPVQELDRPVPRATSGSKKKRKRMSDGLAPYSTAQLAQAKALLCNEQGNGDGRHLIELATPVASVSAYARAVIFKLIPKDFLGTGPQGKANFQHLLECVHQFVACKRFENLTLEAVGHGIKISAIDWLRPPNIEVGVAMAMSDASKRKELLHEFLYYVFDSLLIPLLRANFHVTESSDQKYRLFYFRHDVWRLITQPSLSRIKLDMYQELPSHQAQKMLGERTLGYSPVRLLPKRNAVRPITNLRRRAMVRKKGRVYLGASINSSLRNVFSMMTYEKDHQPTLLRSSIFSVNELYPRLIQLQTKLKAKGLQEAPLYFVKVDVQSCFDTIPQEAVMTLIERICQGNQYTVKHHTEVRAAIPLACTKGVQASLSKPAKKFLAPAHASRSSQHGGFADLLEDRYAPGKRHTVFVEGAVQTRVDTESMIDLLDDHIRRNIVRIGKKYYRQKNGIPQGSILSTLLCSFFYGDFEAHELSFLRKPAANGRANETMLVRLIDDFLVITTERAHAEKFLKTMLAGNATYGIVVKPEKTLTNFKPSTNLSAIRTRIGEPFPWCNTLINTRSLAMTRDRTCSIPYLPKLLTSTEPLLKQRAQASDLADSTTLELCKRAGAAFHRKTLAALRTNVRPMYMDTSFASVTTMRQELSLGLLDVAERASRYIVRLKGLDGGKGLRPKQIQRTIEDVAAATNALLRKSRSSATSRRLSRQEIEQMVVKAFLTIFGRQQARHKCTLVWLRDWQSRLPIGS